MKKFLIISLFLLASCSDENSSKYIELENKYTQLQSEFKEHLNQPKISFVGNNMINSAHYYISISCTKPAPPFIDIPNNQSVEIYLMEDCMANKIPQDILDSLVKKEFYYVSWYTLFTNYEIDKMSSYNFSDIEIQSIANGRWKYVVAPENLSKEQYKILRNTKNLYRIAFEPTGDRNIYTEEDVKKCNAFWGDSLKEGGEKEWKISSEKVLQCYRQVPPKP